MLHPHTELRWIDDDMGYGVFATQLLAKGTITWVLDPLDQVFSPSHVNRLDDQYLDILERYSYYNGRGDRILCWDFARYINHSCDPNTLSPGFDFELALRDIQPGEQMTTDYGSLNLERRFDCECQSPHCRGTIYPNDFETQAPFWDQRIKKAFSSIENVIQPLWNWLPERDRITAAIANPNHIPSITMHRWRDTEILAPLNGQAQKVTTHG